MTYAVRILFGFNCALKTAESFEIRAKDLQVLVRLDDHGRPFIRSSAYPQCLLFFLTDPCGEVQESMLMGVQDGYCIARNQQITWNFRAPIIRVQGYLKLYSIFVANHQAEPQERLDTQNLSQQTLVPSRGVVGSI
jgi:hypothetical protein